MNDPSLLVSDSVVAGERAPADPATAPCRVSCLIFTLNEEIHLESCLAALRDCDDVIVVDSFSTDRTEAIARAHGARFFAHRFTGFGDQRNWAIEHCDLKHRWALILDADERVPPELWREMNAAIDAAPANVAAFRLRRRFHMWGRWLRHSSLYPSWVVRLIDTERVRYVNRGHAETQTVDGDVAALESDLIDENLRGIDEWFERQNRYSSREALYELEQEAVPLDWRAVLRLEPLAVRGLTRRLASRVPARMAVYFLYSYVLKGGWRDGRDGLVYCRMRAIYQGMVAAKKHDLRRSART